MSESHCQLVNCQAGTIAIATTGTVSTSETSSRWRSAARRVVGDRLALAAAAGGAGSVAPYPADSTAATQVVGGDVARRS